MLRIIIILFFSSTLFSQVQTESWLDYVIEENKEEISETSSMNIDNEFYYTIQIAVKKTFDEAMEVVQALNTSDIDAFIQKNDANSEFKASLASTKDLIASHRSVASARNLPSSNSTELRQLPTSFWS